ncbi:hypothetical protein N7G274_001330 [Stereocaulon virgatum]|uniref:Uncharacterized protein n=1 Tax=Stereocaulon virgatum TaxID=373712 RepID=A0ABR4ANH7_9LECA
MKSPPLTAPSLLLLSPLLATSLPISKTPSTLTLRDSTDNYGPAPAPMGNQPGNAGDDNSNLGETSGSESGGSGPGSTNGDAQPGNVTTDGWHDATGQGRWDMMASFWASPQFVSGGGEAGLKARRAVGGVQRAVVG